MKSSSTKREDISNSRRSLLKTGFWGSMLLAGGSLGAGLTGCASTPAGQHQLDADTTGPGYKYRFLSEDDLVLLSAIIPIIVRDQPSTRTAEFDADAEQKRLLDIDTAIYYFSDANKSEVRQLFDLLNFAPTRGLLGGVWSSWDNASDADIEEFLDDWRYSSMSLLNKAYAAIIKIISTSWYIQQENWHLSGYPGLPELATNGLPQFQ